MSAIADGSDTVAVVTRTVAAMLKMPAEKLDADARFETFGIDSIVGMELIARLSREFGIPITPAQFAEVNTLKELAGHIGARAGSLQRAVATTTIGREPAAIPAREATRQRPVARAAGRRGSPRLDRAKPRFGEVLDYVRQRYAIDLAGREFGSIAEIVDALVSDHPHELLFHYNSYPEPDAGLAGDHLHETEAADTPAADPGSSHDIAIVGISCRFPGASSHTEFWDNLVSRKSSIREIPPSRWRWQDHYASAPAPGKTVSRWGALIEDVDCFDATFFGIAPEEASLLDPQERLLYEETYKAFQDAGLNIAHLAGSSTGVFVGYEYSEYEQHLRVHAEQIDAARPYSSSSPAYYLANRLSYAFDLCGPSEVFNINCASSSVAINRAYYSLANGESDLAVASGVSLNLFPGDYIAETQYGLLSPDGTCAVFDDDANGFTRGEGVGVLVLKRLQDAVDDGSTIYAILKSCHQNNRGRAGSVSDIKHEAITNVMKGCYEKASLAPESISYVELDGYATKWGDSFEFEGVKNAFADLPAGEKRCALGSVKGNIGNLEPASGVASVIKVALALHHKTFPATISKKKTNEFIDLESAAHPLYFAESAIPLDVIRREGAAVRAAVNSFSDSGSNLHMVLEEYRAESHTARDEDHAAQQLIVVSARDRARLDDCLQALEVMLSASGANLSLRNVAYTLQTGREQMGCRLAICASSKAELLAQIAAFQAGNAQDRNAQGIYYRDSTAAAANPLAGVITAEMVSAVVERCCGEWEWEQVAVLWTNGVGIPWERIWAGQPARKVPLPGYQFAKDRYWFDMPGSCGAARVADEARQWPAAVPEPAGEAAVARADGGSPAGPVGKLEMLLRQELARQLHKPESDISRGQDYLELGATSLDVISLVRWINSLLGVRLSPSVILRYPDIQRLAAHLAEMHAAEVASLFVSGQGQAVLGGASAAEMKQEGEVVMRPPCGSEAPVGTPEQPIDEAGILDSVRWQGSTGDGVQDYEQVTF